MRNAKPITIAVDAMGGDHGPRVTVPAALAALKREPNLRIVLVGLGEHVRPLVDGADGAMGDRIRILEATQVVAMDEKPQDALRKKKDSSMRVSIDLIRAARKVPSSAKHATN